jgi:hypothetical protein
MIQAVVSHGVGRMGRMLGAIGIHGMQPVGRMERSLPHLASHNSPRHTQSSKKNQQRKASAHAPLHDGTTSRPIAVYVNLPLRL